MIVDLPLLAASLLLLWLPRKWMRRGTAFFRRRRREIDPWNVSERGDPRLSFRGEFSKFRNYVDLLRAGVGSLVLMGRAGLPPVFEAGPFAKPAEASQVLTVQCAVLVIGVLIQTARTEKRHVSFYPAVFFLAGVSMGLCDIRAALFAFALAWAVNPALPDSRGFLTAYAVLIVAFGYLFAGRSDATVMLAGVLVFLPVLLSLLFKRSLMVLVRKARTSRAPG